MYSSNQQNLRNFFYSSRCPGTITLIAIYVITFFALAITQSPLFMADMAFLGALPQRFWTLFTWPLLGTDPPMNLLFAGLWAYWVCGSLERSWGTRTFLAFFFATAGITAFTLWLGGLLLHTGSPPLMGLWVALGAPTIAWCTINRRESIFFWGILKIPAPLLAGLTLVIIWYDMGPRYGAPILGLFALAGCAAAYWYTQSGRYVIARFSSVRGPFNGGGSGQTPHLRMKHFDREPAQPGFSPLRWFRARQEQKKLEKLWKRSFEDDSKK